MAACCDAVTFIPVAALTFVILSVGKNDVGLQYRLGWPSDHSDDSELEGQSSKVSRQTVILRENGVPYRK